eukprot:gene10945-3017_t
MDLVVMMSSAACSCRVEAEKGMMALQGWQLDEQKLAFVYGLLSDSQDPRKQASAKQDLERMCQSPEFSIYLAYVFATANQDSVAEDVIDLLKTNLFGALETASNLIRTSASIMVAAIAAKIGITKWPQLLPSLSQLLDSNDTIHIKSALTTLRHLSEDCHQTLVDKEGKEAGILILSKVMPFFQHEDPEIRILSLQICNQFIISPCVSLLDILPTFIEGIFSLAGDTDTSVQRHVCQALVMLFDARLEHVLHHVLPHINEIIQSEDTSLAQEACEFWITAADMSENDLIGPHLQSILPVILNRMCYTEEDIEWLKLEMRIDAHEEDKDQDIRPHYHKTKSHQQLHQNENSEGNERPQSSDDEDPFSNELDHENMQWGLRRSAAASLDLLANRYGEQILPTVVPLIEQLFQCDEWPRVESGILALGAIAEGCMFGLSGYLPTLIPYLTDLLSHQQPLIRSITCWALSRYCRWVVLESEDERLFDRTLTSLLNAVCDSNKRVQQDACLAFSLFAEIAEYRLEPQIPLIFQTLMQAYQVYQRKNRAALYDTIGTLAESIGFVFSDPTTCSCLQLNVQGNLQAVMKPIATHFSKLPDDDPECISLLECASSIAFAAGLEYIPYATTFFTRCTVLSQKTLQQAELADRDPEIPYPNPDFCVVPLEHLSAMSEALQNNFSSLVQDSPLLDVLQVALMHQIPDIRQAGFALLGDLSKLCFHLISPYLGVLLQMIVQNIHPAQVAACNNAVWCLGEIAMRLENNVQSWLPDLHVCDLLVELMCRPMTARTLLENTAITIGRIGIFWPDELAPKLSRYLANWSMALRDIADSDEKEHAFMGMCAMIRKNPQDALKTFIFFCDAVNSFRTSSSELQAEFHEVLHAFKAMAGDAWDDYFGKFPPHLQLTVIESFLVSAYCRLNLPFVTVL